MGLGGAVLGLTQRFEGGDNKPGPVLGVGEVTNSTQPMASENDCGGGRN